MGYAEVTLSPEQIETIRADNEARLEGLLQFAGHAFPRISSESDYIEYAAKFGSYYFSPDTMRFFGTKTYRGFIRRDGLIYMRISDIYWDGSRVYSIVAMDIAGNVSRIKQAENLSSKRTCDRVWAKLEKG